MLTKAPTVGVERLTGPDSKPGPLSSTRVAHTTLPPQPRSPGRGERNPAIGRVAGSWTVTSGASRLSD